VDSVTHPLLVGARIGMCVWLAWHLFGMILVALYSPKALFSGGVHMVSFILVGFVVGMKLSFIFYCCVLLILYLCF
jgi:hypothetical protein